MPLGRRVFVAGSLGPSFRQLSRVPLLFVLSLIHGKLWLETSSLAEEYTVCCTVFKQVQRDPDLWLGIDQSIPFRPAGAKA